MLAPFCSYSLERCNEDWEVQRLDLSAVLGTAAAVRMAFSLGYACLTRQSDLHFTDFAPVGQTVHGPGGTARGCCSGKAYMHNRNTRAFWNFLQLAVHSSMSRCRAAGWLKLSNMYILKSCPEPVRSSVWDAESSFKTCPLVSGRSMWLLYNVYVSFVWFCLYFVIWRFDFCSSVFVLGSPFLSEPQTLCRQCLWVAPTRTCPATAYHSQAFHRRCRHPNAKSRISRTNAILSILYIVTPCYTVTPCSSSQTYILQGDDASTISVMARA